MGLLAGWIKRNGGWNGDGTPEGLTPEQLALVNGNPGAQGVYDTGMAALDTRDLQANQARTWGEAAAGNWGQMAATGADTPGGAAAGRLLGDAAGGALRMFGQESEAGAAAQMAGQLADAQNGRARAGIMEGAGRTADAMNLQNAARGAALADSAIASDNAFESGMADVGMSGIEGSGNMERNLKYGKSRSEAARDMEHAMMGQEAQGLGGSLVQSFDSLSQGKAGAMQSAWGGSMADFNAGLTAQYKQTGEAVMAAQTSPQDRRMVEEQALKAAEENPALPGEAQTPAKTPPELDAAAEANRNAVAEKENRDAAAWEAQKAAQAQASPAPAQTAQAAQAPAAGAADTDDRYSKLEALLKVKGGVSAPALEKEMVGMGIDEAMRKKIQAETMSATGGDWRGRLRAALGG
jgi:hypothetical protein